MKKTYYATCMPGLEHAVEALLQREPGVVLDWIHEGSVTFRADQKPNFPYLHNVFLVLQTMSGLKDLDGAVKKLLLAGDWLDRMPFDALSGKRFRIVCMHGDQLVSVDMKYLHLLEQVICQHTGMSALRERPDVELWLIRCSERVTLFTWRLEGRRAGKGPGAGALREDLCTVMASLAKAGGKSALCIGFGSQDRIQAALYAAGCRHTDMQREGRGLTAVDDASVGALLARLFMGNDKISQPEAEARTMLLEAVRVLKPGGRAVLLAPEGRLDNAISQLPQLEVVDRLPLRMGGRKNILWVITPLLHHEE